MEGGSTFNREATVNFQQVPQVNAVHAGGQDGKKVPGAKERESAADRPPTAEESKSPVSKASRPSSRRGSRSFLPFPSPGAARHKAINFPRCCSRGLLKGARHTWAIEGGGASPLTIQKTTPAPDNYRMQSHGCVITSVTPKIFLCHQSHLLIITIILSIP